MFLGSGPGRHLSVDVSRVSSVSSIASVSGVSVSGDDSDIVRMASSVGIVYRESMGNLTNGVGIRISLTLAIEAIASIASIASVVATVANSSVARDEAMAIVNSSDDTTAIAIGSLADGVWLAVC